MKKKATRCAIPYRDLAIDSHKGGPSDLGRSRGDFDALVFKAQHTELVAPPRQKREAHQGLRRPFWKGGLVPHKMGKRGENMAKTWRTHR